MLPHNDMVRPMPFRLKHGVLTSPGQPTLGMLILQTPAGETDLVVSKEDLDNLLSNLMELKASLDKASGLVVPPKGLFVAKSNGHQFPQQGG